MLQTLFKYTLPLLIAGLFLLTSNVEASQYNHDSLIKVINSSHDDLDKLQTYSKLIKSNPNGIGEEGKLYLDYAFELAEEIENEIYSALFFCYLGEYQIEKGDYSAGLLSLQKAISIGERIESDSILALANTDIAIIFYILKNFDTAEEHILKALDYSKKAGIVKYYSTLFNLLGGIYGEQNKPLKAKSYMFKYLEYGQMNKSYKAIVSAYNNLALLSLEMDQPDSAIYYANRALDVAKKENYLNGEHTLCNSMIRIYLEMESYDLAEVFLRRALRLKEKSNAPRKVLFTYKYAYNYFKLIGESDSALNYFEIYVAYKDSLFSTEQLNKITELQIQLETAQHNHIIRSLESKNHTKSIIIIASSLILILVIFLSLLFLRSSRLKSQLVKNENAVLEEKSQSMMVKMDYQKKEMVYNALFILNQVKIYNGLINNLKRIEKLPNEEWAQALRSIIVKIQRSKQTVDKKGFESEFKRSNEDFFNQLLAKYPSLTKRDLDLCAYLKLGMSTKEIASMTNQSIRALEVARSRLRKKLNLDSSINLSEFIRSF